VTSPGPECDYAPGDINADSAINGLDVVFGANYFRGDAVPSVDCHPICVNQPNPFYAAGDVNGNCVFNGIDITFFVRYLKGQVPNLLFCLDCPPITTNLLIDGKKDAPPLLKKRGRSEKLWIK
jgi:hypothetical protein